MYHHSASNLMPANMVMSQEQASGLIQTNPAHDCWNEKASTTGVRPRLGRTPEAHAQYGWFCKRLCFIYCSNQNEYQFCKFVHNKLQMPTPLAFVFFVEILKRINWQLYVLHFARMACTMISRTRKFTIDPCHYYSNANLLSLAAWIPQPPWAGQCLGNSSCRVSNSSSCPRRLWNSCSKRQQVCITIVMAWVRPQIYAF